MLDRTCPLSEPTAAAIDHRRDVLDSADEVFKEWRELLIWSLSAQV